MSTACPDVDLLVALGEGRCSPKEAEDLLQHVRGCVTCTLLLEQLDDRVDEGRTQNALIDEVSDAVMSLMLEAGESAGRYVVRSVVGEGAMGVVYEAHDPELDRRVALKALKIDPRDANTRGMLTLEGQALGQLQHPNVVPVFDIGRSHRGWFIAMEFVDGQPLGAWCEGKPWDAIVDRFAEAARGLAAAHRVGIIHRDFKPANVLVGSDDRARVADFGIAVDKTVIAAESNTRSSEGEPRGSSSTHRELIGTIAYMAPEQLEGLPATERSDQYAFFVALFEMLEGHRPFQGKSTSTLLRARRAGAPKLERSGIPRELAAAIERGLSFEAENRHASMQHVAGLLTDLRRPRAGTKAWLLALGGLGIVGAAVASRPPKESCESLATATAAKWKNVHRPALRQRWSDAPATLARVERRLDTFVHRWVADWTTSCGMPEVEAQAKRACLRRTLTEFEEGAQVLLEPDMAESKVMDVAMGTAPSWTRCSETSSGVTGLFAGFVDGWLARAMSLYRADRYEDVRVFLEEHQDTIELIGSPTQRARAANIMGRAETFEGDERRGLKRLEVAHELAVEAGADDLAADIANSIFTVSPSMDPAYAQRWMDHARADAERSTDPEVRARFHAAVGWHEIRRGHETTAAAEADAAEAVMTSGRPYPELRWNVLALRGQIALAARDYETCSREFEASLDELARWYGPGSVSSIQPRAGLLQCMLGVEDFEMAELLLDEQQQVLELAGLYPGEKADSLMVLRASMLASTGDDLQAIEILEELTGRIDEEHRIWASAWNRLGLALAREGDYTGSRAVFERLRVHQEEHYGRTSVKLAITLHNLAEAESGLGDYAAAARHYREAMDITRAHEDPGALLAYSLTGLGEVELARGNLGRARDLIEQALAIPHGDRDERAEATASLARTLWRLGDPANRSRALELAHEAATAFDTLPGYEDHAIELRRWRETL